MNLDIYINIYNSFLIKHMGKKNPKYLKLNQDIKKITNIKEKYFFYKENLNDFITIKCYIKAQKKLFFLYKLVNNLKKKRNTIFNNEDLLGNLMFKNKYISLFKNNVFILKFSV